MKVHSASSAICLVIAIALFGAGCQRPGVQAANESGGTPATTGDSLTSWDSDFLSTAAKAEAKVQTFSGVAVKRAQSVAVQEYAQATMEDSGSALQQVLELMKKKALAPPVYLPEVKIEAADRLQSVSGGAFDHEFISLMAAEQQQLASTFRKAAETAADPEVRAYAKGVAPVIQKNYEKAAGMEKSLAKKPAE